MLVEETYTREAPTGLRVVSCQAIEAPNNVPIRLNHPELEIRVSIEPTAEIGIGWYHLELCFPPEGVVDLIVSISFDKGEQFWLRPVAVDRNHFSADLRVRTRSRRLL